LRTAETEFWRTVRLWGGLARLVTINAAAFTDSGGGAAWNVMAFRRGGDARSIPRIRIPGEHTRDRSVLVGKLAEILKDQRPTRKVAAMFIDMAFGSPIYERLRALGFNIVSETNFGLVHTPDHTKANMRAYMWDKMKDWLLHGAIETDEKMAAGGRRLRACRHRVLYHFQFRQLAPALANADTMAAGNIRNRMNSS
jgi:hypothetical protein